MKKQASDLLLDGVNHMRDRATTYDAPEGERSMAKTVAMFNKLTDNSLSEEDGWMFMVLLKVVRSQQGNYREDNYADGAAYMALAGETASQKRAKK